MILASLRLLVRDTQSTEYVCTSYFVLINTWRGKEIVSAPLDVGYIDKYPLAAPAPHVYLSGTSVWPTAKGHCLVFARSTTPKLHQHT